MTRVLPIAGFVFCALALLACRHRSGVHTIAARPFRGQAQLAAVASAELECPNLSFRSIDPRVVEVVGCGDAREFMSDPWRRRWESFTPVAAQAPSDLRCADTRVIVSSPSDRVRAATGCGRVARYDLVCDDEHCRWSMTAHSGAWAGRWTEPRAPLTSDRSAYETADPR